MEKIKVVKRDGTKEAYDPEKIKRVIMAANATAEEADEVIAKVDEELKKLDVPEINSIKIRDVVLEKLREVNNYAAGMYSWYQKTKTDGEFKNGDA